MEALQDHAAMTGEGGFTSHATSQLASNSLRASIRENL